MRKSGLPERVVALLSAVFATAAAAQGIAHSVFPLAESVPSTNSLGQVPAIPPKPTAKSEPRFGNPLWVQSAVIVDFAGLAPGMIGVYQLNLRVPGFHISGDSLLVTITAGGV